MGKIVKVPVYNQEIIIYNNFEDPDRYAITETPPLSLKYNKDCWSLPLLAHECVHLTNFLLANVGQGMPAKDSTGYFDDEYYSYLYAEIFNIILNKTKNDLKEFKKNGSRNKRTKKMLQHRSKKTDKPAPGTLIVVDA